MKKQDSEKLELGFTLVELAIVLVIIGLLVTGVLAGQELITQAKVAKTVSTLKDIDRAVLTFRLKYGDNGKAILPGDFNRASQMGLDKDKNGTLNVAETDFTNYNGNGDRLLSNQNLNALNMPGEVMNFWVHLANAELIKGGYSQTYGCSAAGCNLTAGETFPKDAFGTGILFFTTRTSGAGFMRKAGNYYILGTNPIVPTDGVASVGATCTGVTNSYCIEGGDGIVGERLRPEIAYALDNKLDDGKPDTGLMTVVDTARPTTWILIDTSLSSTDCYSSTGGDYNVAYKEQTCTLAFTAGF